jgi:predicted DNA-binding protein (UPF0278 family)
MPYQAADRLTMKFIKLHPKSETANIWKNDPNKVDLKHDDHPKSPAAENDGVDEVKESHTRNYPRKDSGGNDKPGLSKRIETIRQKVKAGTASSEEKAKLKYYTTESVKESLEEIFEVYVDNINEWLIENEDYFQSKYGNNADQVMYKTAWNLVKNASEIEITEDVAAGVLTGLTALGVGAATGSLVGGPGGATGGAIISGLYNTPEIYRAFMDGDPKDSKKKTDNTLKKRVVQQQPIKEEIESTSLFSSNYVKDIKSRFPNDKGMHQIAHKDSEDMMMVAKHLERGDILSANQHINKMDTTPRRSLVDHLCRNGYKQAKYGFGVQSAN